MEISKQLLDIGLVNAKTNPKIAVTFFAPPTQNYGQITISAVRRIGSEVRHIVVAGVRSGLGMDGSLLVREGRYCHTSRLNVQHCADLESAGVAAVEDCQKEGHHILKFLLPDNLEAAGIAAKTGLLDEIRRYLGFEFLQKVVAECLVGRRKLVAD
jgi:hypothetical protein